MSTAKVHQSFSELSRLASKDLYTNGKIVSDVAEYLGLVLKNTNSKADEYKQRKQLAFGYWLALASLHERLISERSNIGTHAAMIDDENKVLHSITNYQQNRKLEDRVLKILSTTSKDIFDIQVRIEANRVYNHSKIDEALGRHKVYLDIILPNYRSTTPLDWISVLKIDIKNPEMESPDFTASLTF